MSNFMTEIGSLVGSHISRIDGEIAKNSEILEVADITTRDAIPAEDRFNNMWVKVLGGVDAEGNDVTNHIYYLDGGISNASWKDLFEGVQAPTSNNSIDAAFFDGKDSSEWIGEIDSRVALSAPLVHSHDTQYLALNGIADNSTKFGGQLPAYFAEASRVADIETLLTSDDVALDSLQEVVTFVKTNRGDIDAITPAGIGAAAVGHDHDETYLGKTDKAADSFTVNGLTVDTAVPAGAEFTDTVYNHPDTHPMAMVTGLTDALTGKADTHDHPYAPDSHTTDSTNPHNVTKAQVGLGNVDNTSDANKPVSTATQAALDGKSDNHSHPYASDSHSHDDNYLGKTAKAADSDKLDGHDSSYFAQTHSHPYASDSHNHSGLYLESETTTSIELLNNKLRYTDENGTLTEIPLSSYIDDTNLARITSGSVATNGVATFTRDDSTTFTIDMSLFLDDTKLSKAEIDAMGVNAATVNGLIVATAVPSGAEFTDTVYSHPNTHPISMITGLQDALDSIQSSISTIISDMSTDTERDTALASLDGGTF